MKKLLLATTAVAGLAFMPAAAHAEIDLDLGGYFKGYAGYTDQDTNGTRDFDIKRESEIHINGETTLDNGLTVGARFEIQTEADDNVNGNSLFEESYVYFSGNWGRVNFGAEDGAAYLLQVAAPSADSNIDGIDPDIEFVNFAGTVVTPLNYELAPTQDADKITYLTPKLSGFQGGLSYAPDAAQDTAGQNLTGQVANTSAAVTNLQDIYELSARYDGDLDGIGIHAGAGYITANQDNSGGSNNEYEGWNIGLKFDIGAFGLGASYSEQENFTGTNEDSEVMVLGADYTTGAYKFGASYFNSETDVGAVTDEIDRYSFGAGYTYGPGLSFRGSVHVYEIDDDQAAGDNDAVAFVLGTDIQF